MPETVLPDRLRRALLMLPLAVVLGAGPVLAAPDATALLRAAFNNWRATSSATTMTMTIHRPDWERHSTMQSWTQGTDKALVRFTDPPGDAGNATLKIGNDTWVFNPKLNQVIKLPASMLAQSWMGSDFSYDDLAKSDDVLTLYTHRIIGTGQSGGHTVYTVEAVPKPGAPVVWGKLTAQVRDDGVFLGETYFDQGMQPVRTMTVDRLSQMGGRIYPAVLTMRPVSPAGQWTRVETTQASFDISLPAYTFTRSNLQNPRN
ncbi:MAG: outer membrane lipoprotein-sorting protein [Limimaricola sp.]|uniref:outer membrane lipoprotein-sorting protein n=1 Tax=Limimaricola sp. TaxID=2211665 RepID=UPI001D5F433B|nr:outer membrane lipoprotein-sorting protein [Limimaricola sp.]MBI1418168.1 outer membrane lipoprotein-sorting protein [Limimaricola sp.]